MDTELTLQQGLDKFNEKNKSLFSDKSISEEGELFLKHHDIAHVVFGCDTSIYGEGVVKIWTTFGSTLSFWEVVTGYNDASAFELASQYSFGHIIKNIGRFLWVIPKTIIRAKRMSKPWPFMNYAAYLNMPISEIRAAFSIEII